MAFPFLTVFMVFIIGLSIRYAVLNKRREEKFDRFWEKEKEADHTPAKDLSTVSFLKVPIQSFPMGKWEDDEIAMIEERLRALSEKKLLNLTGKTNTELKLEYGTANLEIMSAIGEDFNELTVLLVDYAKALMEKHDYEGAAAVLEYGMSVGTDVSSDYTLLADCYLALGHPEKIELIKEQVQNRDLLLEQKIISYLDACTDPTADR